MMPQGFVVAMRAKGRCCRADAPGQAPTHAGCWLLVTRSGRHGEFLSIGHAGGHAGGQVGRDMPPPPGLTPLASCLGVLGPQAPLRGPAGFVLQPEPLPGLQLGGCFLRASGVAWVDASRGRLRLSLLGQITADHAGPWQSGTWRLDAVQTPWIGELLDHGSPTTQLRHPPVAGLASAPLRG